MRSISLSNNRLVNIFLCAMVCPGAAFSGSGHERVWTWDDTLAYTKFRHGISIGVLFISPSPCDRAALIVAGNNKIEKIGLAVDGKTWEFADARTNEHGSYIELNKSALKALKSGNNAAVITDRGLIPMDLAGSARAINEAWRQCEAMNTPPFQVLEPEGVDQLPQPQSTNDSPFRSVFREESGGFSAVGNVIFYSGEMVMGDEERLQIIVENMERAGISFRALVFLTSPGGSLTTAMQIGDFVRGKQANTAAYELCASACIYAFSGGVTRTSYHSTRFGLHQASYADGKSGSLVEGQKLAAMSYSYLEKKGVNPKIAIWESAVEPDTMRWISQYEAKGLHLVTRILEDYELPSSQSMESITGAGSLAR